MWFGEGVIAVCYRSLLIILIGLFSCTLQAECLGSCSLATLAPKAESETPLLIFISLGMPEQSLKALSQQAKKVSGKLLIRGFIDNDLQATTQKALAVFGEDWDNLLWIDPESFDKFQIQVVPAFVLKEPDLCLSNECPAPKFDVVYGDIPLVDALEQLYQGGSQHSQTLSKKLLAQFKGSHD